MADPGERVFLVPPGADFPAAVAAGLRSRFNSGAPEDMARVELFVNTARMRREIRAVLAASGAAYLPRLRLLSELDSEPLAGLPPAMPPLRQRLILARFVSHLLDHQPDLAPRAALFDLADSLSDLIDEMQDEGVTPDGLSALDVSDHSAHWKRTQDFLAIVTPFFQDAALMTAAARRRAVVEALVARWQANPPDHPVIVAGSTGSRGTTARLMQAVARLPQGALVLPAFDGDLPAAVWSGMEDALTAEDHPQFRFQRLLQALDVPPRSVAGWCAAPVPDPARNRLVSLSLRPAPVTDQWLTEGRGLPELTAATQGLTLIEAPGPRAEALAVALILREAAETGQTAALVTPDRVLTRQVTAALDRWGILPDDSAGRPLALSAPGRLLRHVAALFGRRLTAEALLIVLKHPLTATGGDRGRHLLWTRDLELSLRRRGPAYPTGADLQLWASSRRDGGVTEWADWIATTLDGVESVVDRALADHLAHHRSLAERLAAGPGAEGSGELWQREAGEAALATLEGLAREAEHGGILSPPDYEALFGAVLSRGEVREAVQSDPRIRILGPREAREIRAERVILAGLNDGIWPRLPAPDPWLNRQMRQKAGLLLPERQVGLAAHDYQQAIGAPQVYLIRARRDAEAETVPSRWINRLVNLMGGLPTRGGPEALAAMRARGKVWLDRAEALDRPAAPTAPARRPAPRPPVAARPLELPVTGIGRLIRDPYAIYARYILGLRPLDPLRQTPDALARGSILHAILEQFIREARPESLPEARDRLLDTARAVLLREAPWPAARLLWLARLDRAADAFLMREAASDGRAVMIEDRGAVDLPGLGFRLTAKPDRIDELPDGRLHILDYKTGTPPSKKQQESFDKQLLLEAAMAERGGFAALGPREVARISYVGLNATASVVETELTPEMLDETWVELHSLISRYMTPAQGYPARRAVMKAGEGGDYDHLARFGEWDMSDRPTPEDVG